VYAHHSAIDEVTRTRVLGFTWNRVQVGWIYSDVH
jgi:hypothetical protein